MSENKIMLKDGVLSRGVGNRRVILDYDAGLVYKFNSPDKILAVYDTQRGWVCLEQPSYYRGGWGNSSSGDADGHYTVENAHALVKAIGGRLYSVNSNEFHDPKVLAEINKGIEKNNELIKIHNALAKKLGRELNHDLLTPEFTKYRKENDGKSRKGTDPIKTARSYESSVQVFLQRKGKTVKIDDYKISVNQIVQGKTIVAFRDSKGDIFMNSQVLNITHFEREFMGGQSLIQAEVRKAAKYSIPLNVLESANLKLNETRVLEQGPESDHRIYGVNKWGQRNSSLDQDRHFTGALLLENSGRKFLMDIDREEIKHGIFNAFFVEVERKVKTIAEAYESMKPQEVRDAESKGLKVERQGEWFFIQTDETVTVRKEDVNTWFDKDVDKQVHRFDVSHGKGRPNRLYRPVGFGDLDKLVCGTVTHTGREHRDLDLGSHAAGKNGEFTVFKLWKLVPNATISNFTITGDID